MRGLRHAFLSHFPANVAIAASGSGGSVNQGMDRAAPFGHNVREERTKMEVAK